MPVLSYQLSANCLPVCFAMRSSEVLALALDFSPPSRHGHTRIHRRLSRLPRLFRKSHALAACKILGIASKERSCSQLAERRSQTAQQQPWTLVFRRRAAPFRPWLHRRPRPRRPCRPWQSRSRSRTRRGSASRTTSPCWRATYLTTRRQRTSTRRLPPLRRSAPCSCARRTCRSSRCATRSWSSGRGASTRSWAHRVSARPRSWR